MTEDKPRAVRPEHVEADPRTDGVADQGELPPPSEEEIAAALEHDPADDLYERTWEPGQTGLLPPLPESAYPPGAVPAPRPRRRRVSRYTSAEWRPLTNRSTRTVQKDLCCWHTGS